MKILIVGSSSFLASHLINTLSDLGTIFGAQRSLIKNPLLTEIVHWKLGEKLPENILRTCNWVIFCAHDLSSDNKNFEHYQILTIQLKSFQNIQYIFISSLSSYPDAPGQYGKEKYQIEQLFGPLNGYIVRPGLIIGKGGLFQSIRQAILKYPLVPIIGYKKSPIFYISIQDVCFSIRSILVTLPTQKMFNLFYKIPTDQIELARQIKKINSKSLYYIRLPLLFFEWAIFIFKLAKLTPPISEDNLKGYTKNSQAIRSSDIDKLLGDKNQQNRSLNNCLLQNFAD